MNILIPRITDAKLTGYEPIFSTQVDISIKKNLFILLGGNGLGKTTILQSIIYGLAGPSDDNIEPQFKERRWSRNYFKDRLSNPNNSTIEITFDIGDYKVTVTRNFLTDRIVCFSLNDKVISEDKTKAETEFESFLVENCGYNSLSDFNFIIHKLCYLSEKRENLAWDIESQTRILMQILSDQRNIENQFRDRRSQLKELDSSIRHKNVHINDLKRRINDSDSEIIKEAEPEKNEFLSEQIKIEELQTELLMTNNQYVEKQNSYHSLRFDHKGLVDEVEQLRDTLSKYEHAFLFDQLNKYETNESRLAIYKLIHYRLCPACGNKSDELYRQAQEYLKNQCCPICGIDHSMGDQDMHPGIEAELSEKLEIKIRLENEMISAERN